jgi:hypothetical protein
MKKIILILSIVSIAILNAKVEKINTTKRYEKGWWWYEETYHDKDKNKTKIIKYKVSPAEKLKIEKEEQTNKLLKMMVKQQIELKKQNEELKNLTKKIKDRLKYAFPYTTPLKIKDKNGKECIANSSADCFILPVIAEAQHVPVFKKFLRNPSPENSKDWLKWQAKYFNHLRSISTGLRFSFLKNGSDVYKTSTDYSYGDNPYFSKSETFKAVREAKIIHKYKDKIGFLFFIGQNFNYEKIADIYKSFTNFNSTFLSDMSKAIIFPSEEAKNNVLNYINVELKNKGYYEIVEFFDSIKKVVKPELYKKYNIRLTPSTVLFYKDKKSYWQTILTGNVSPDFIRQNTMKFLKYYKIVEEKEMGADKNWNIIEKPINKFLKAIPKPQTPFDFKKKEKILKEYEENENE